MIIASEVTSAAPVWEIVLAISTIALVIVSVALTVATWDLFKVTVKALSHDNDNMTDVARDLADDDKVK